MPPRRGIGLRGLNGFSRARLGADQMGTLAPGRHRPAYYMIVSVDTVLKKMAAQGMIPAMSGLSPLKAADLVHAEAQFLDARRAG